jgi:hypothetical protein
VDNAVETARANVDAALSGWSRCCAWIAETDCVAGHEGLELRNVSAKYPFERSHGFPGNQQNSGYRDYSRLNCGVWETQLGPNATISAGMLARASGHCG